MVTGSSTALMATPAAGPVQIHVHAAVADPISVGRTVQSVLEKRNRAARHLMIYEWSVQVADGEIRDLVLDGRSQIRYGRTTSDVQPEPTSATLTLSLRRGPFLCPGLPLLLLNPEQIPTGFVDDWSDTYEGVDTVLEVGARVLISISGASDSRTPGRTSTKAPLTNRPALTGTLSRWTTGPARCN